MKIEKYDPNNPDHKDRTKYEVVEWEKELAGRRPEQVSFTNAEEDAKRRDFTINAIFYDPIEDKYIDYVEGQKDIERRVIRAIGKPTERFSEDYLRLMRGIRFAAQKGFRIENSTLQAIKEVAGNISKISKERIKAEMDKILMSDRPGDYLELLDKVGLLQELLPEVAELKNFAQNPKFHPEGDSRRHTFLALNASRKDLTLRWALLFHDLGKADTHTVTDTGRIMHPGHSKFSVKKADEIMRKYKFDSKTRDDVLWLIQKHDVFMNWNEMKKSKKMKLVAHPLIDTLIDHYEADRRSTNVPEHIEHAMRNIKRYRDEINTFKADVDKFKQVEKFDLVGGKDLLDMGLPQGSLFRDILRDVKNKYLEGELTDREQMLDYIRSKYVKKEEIQPKSKDSLLNFLNEN